MNPTEIDISAKDNCYEAAYRLMMNYGGWEEVYLCHGIATKTTPPHERMGHAWVEVEMECQNTMGYITVVFDALFPKQGILKWVYYTVGRVSDVVRYTRGEAVVLACREECYGPWDAKVAEAAHADSSSPARQPIEEIWKTNP
jgi:hypothetical protein